MKTIFPAVKLRPQTLPIHNREIGDAAIHGERRIHASPSGLSPPPPTRAISQWARSLEWRHVVTLHTAIGKKCVTFFPFSYEACSLYLVLWLCDFVTLEVIYRIEWINETRPTCVHPRNKFASRSSCDPCIIVQKSNIIVFCYNYFHLTCHGELSHLFNEYSLTQM